MTLLKNPKAKRRLLCPAAWHFLRKFYPQGPAFKARSTCSGEVCSGAMECMQCGKETEEAKNTVQQNLARELSRRKEEYVPPVLRSLVQRRSGVPTHLLRARVSMFAGEVGSASHAAGAGAGGDDSSSNTVTVGVPIPRAGSLQLQLESYTADIAPVTHSFVSASPGVTPSYGVLDLEDYYSHGGGASDFTPPEYSTGTDTDFKSEAEAIVTPVTQTLTAEQQDRNSIIPLLEQQAAEVGISVQELCDLQGVTIEEAMRTRNDAVLADHLLRHGRGSQASGGAAAASTSAQAIKNEQGNVYMPELYNEGVVPLLPGLYNLVPRTWLKKWRTYTREPTAQVPLADADCDRLLCHSHGLLVVPPHLEDYLAGARRSLLGGLGAYEGDVVEIVSAEEWDALQSLVLQSVFSVGFALDTEGNITWSCTRCLSCDPLTYNKLRRGREGKKCNNNQERTNAQTALLSGYAYTNAKEDFAGAPRQGLIHIGNSVSVLTPPDTDEYFPIASSVCIATGSSGSSSDPDAFSERERQLKQIPPPVVNMRDFEEVGDVIVDDPCEYPLLGSTPTSSSITSAAATSGAGTGTGADADNRNNRRSAWSKNIPSPVRRAGGPRAVGE